MAHSDCRRACGCAGKTVRSLENTWHTCALLRWWFTKRRYIKCTYFSFAVAEEVTQSCSFACLHVRLWLSGATQKLPTDFDAIFRVDSLRSRNERLQQFSKSSPCSAPLSPWVDIPLGLWRQACNYLPRLRGYLIASTHEWMALARLNWPRWMLTCRDGLPSQH